MATEYKKIDDSHVAKVGTQEVKQLFSSKQLEEMKARFEAQLAEVIELQNALK